MAQLGAYGAFVHVGDPGGPLSNTAAGLAGASGATGTTLPAGAHVTPTTGGVHAPFPLSASYVTQPQASRLRMTLDALRATKHISPNWGTTWWEAVGREHASVALSP